MHRVGHVAGDGDDAGQLVGQPGQVGRPPGVDDDAPAAGGEGVGQGAAEPAGGAGDQGSRLRCVVMRPCL